ncbi:ABC transporter substrate-binding protein [Sinanaerobacter sp. ZZT-01]|uniref:ABC transporter substrate-binding protein n=1 Tax=Sinanaerobacter sp. ZZT-01 TaxID=3111540 RepID=UPI002D7773D0|nr:MqnA/MqnD/SBP family protein [Sinanaerobacter sp. ZZT-01]WRR93532.1 MqnA/MqnD/SBP family protein [Sinanaerobacter sp. ZZT-01]
MNLNSNKSMRFWSFLLVIFMLLSIMTACGLNENKEEEKELAQPIKIASLKGPTSMALTSLMTQEGQYEITAYQNPQEAASKLSTGEVDIAAVSSNLGAVLFNKTKGDVKLVSVNTGGVLYLVENGKQIRELQDLKGKTILASGKGGTPEYVIKCLLLKNGLDPEKDVDFRWLGNHTDTAGALMAEENSVALLPEPFVSAVTAKNEEINVAVDLNTAWKSQFHSELPMGIFLTTKAFAEERKEDLDLFLSEVEGSVDFVNKKPEEAAKTLVKKGVMDKEEIAAHAIPRCNIIDLKGEDARQALDTFYQILYDMDAGSVGGKLPDNTFYLNLE